MKRKQGWYEKKKKALLFNDSERQSGSTPTSSYTCSAIGIEVDRLGCIGRSESKIWMISTILVKAKRKEILLQV
ncbi:hypothetical protein BRADI_4g43095v3 [Brachypodium distachyon]|uniref:Uncharacterized protein n=1 Tax=Brachypodium distachyon TaxID=15368 RepID=A0A2K2CTY4_BRADI|nr:hypothetical protein BRADI_4g43095v3 [Brachypodium distachyon]